MKTRRYEISTFINEETCGYEIFDHVFGRVVDRGTGYDGNYASMRGAQNSLDWLTGEHWALQPKVRSNHQFSTDCHGA